MKLVVLTSALAISGCGTIATTELPAPRAGGAVAPNVVSIPSHGSEELELPDDALMSHASLVSVSDEATCFDVLIRQALLFGGERERALTVSVEVDGAGKRHYEEPLQACTAERPCLPAGSMLESYAIEDDRRIHVAGKRVCFDKLPRARRELVLSASPGAGGWKFRFRFTDAAG